MISVRAVNDQDREWIAAKLVAGWGGPVQAYRGEKVDCLKLRGVVAGNREGLLIYRPFGADAFDIVLLEAFERWEGIGTSLVEALAALASEAGRTRLVVTTTNDNLDALRFYQDRDFHLVELRSGAVAAARQVKPGISVRGYYGLPVRDEIDLERALSIA